MINEFKRDLDKTISSYDEELSNFMTKEFNRQEEHIELIASENYASKRVLEAPVSYTHLTLPTNA